MADQTNRNSVTPGKGGCLRIIWKPNPAVELASLVVLPASSFTFESDPHNENMTESDSKGHFYAPTLADYLIRVDLRRRTGNMTLDALGIRGVSYVDRVLIDIGNSGLVDIIDGLAVGPYNRNAQQTQNIMEGFSLQGGEMVGRAVSLPSYAVTAGTIPNLTAYLTASMSVPSGL